ncbi:MAG TPA: cytochrome c biogenesis protein/redoxin, partial [Pyrinomonadaceae bacterium]
QMMGVLKIGALYRDTRKFSDDKPSGPLGAALLGVAFAAGWTPCIGPILGGIIGLAATSGGWKSGLVLSAFYAAGLAIPFLVVGLLMNAFLGFYAKFRRHLHKVEVASGVLLIVIGLMVASNSLTWVSSLASRYLPDFERRFAGQPSPTDPVPQPTVQNAAGAEPAPEVEVTTLDGKPLKVSELRGQVVLLNFWATWCVPCRSEIPSLNAMHRDLSGRGFRVIGVTTNDSAELVRDYQKEVKQDYTVALGDDGVAGKYSVGVLPTTFIIDRQGRIRHKIIGEKSRAQFEALINPLLDEPPATAAALGGE